MMMLIVSTKKFSLRVRFQTEKIKQSLNNSVDTKLANNKFMHSKSRTRELHLTNGRKNHQRCIVPLNILLSLTPPLKHHYLMK